MKSQVAVEYLIIVSVALAIIVPIITYSNTLFIGYKDDISLTLAKNLVEKIGESADWVYSQGYPAKVSLKINVPERIVGIYLINKTILLKIKTSSGISDISYTGIAPLNGSLPSSPGIYTITIEALEEYINISW